MHIIFLALGSNVGNKKKHITDAIAALSSDVKNIYPAKLYKTEPMYYQKQDLFVNTVIKGQTDLTPESLLTFVKSLETSLGRKKMFRNGPREIDIDIDIIFYDDISYTSPHLIIPHPRLAERDFVLKPFLDIDPDFIHPVLKKTIKELYNDFSLQTNKS